MTKEGVNIKHYKRIVKKFEHNHHIFAALLVGSALVLMWRGIWNLADIYLFPNQDFLSAIISILIGFLILYMRDFNLKEFLAH